MYQNNFQREIIMNVESTLENNVVNNYKKRKRTMFILVTMAWLECHMYDISVHLFG